jgi:hypothetical protein
MVGGSNMVCVGHDLSRLCLDHIDPCLSLEDCNEAPIKM